MSCYSTNKVGGKEATTKTHPAVSSRLKHQLFISTTSPLACCPPAMQWGKRRGGDIFGLRRQMRARLRRGMPWKRKRFLFFFFSGPPPGKEKGKIIFTKREKGLGVYFLSKLEKKRNLSHHTSSWYWKNLCSDFSHLVYIFPEKRFIVILIPFKKEIKKQIVYGKPETCHRKIITTTAPSSEACFFTPVIPTAFYGIPVEKGRPMTRENPFLFLCVSLAWEKRGWKWLIVSNFENGSYTK